DLVELVRPDLARSLDLTQVEFIEQEAFSDFPEGERSIADLVAKVSLDDGSERLLLIQVEVEGQFRRAMDERAFFYFVHLRLKYRLPLVTIVIFLSGGQTPLEVREYLDQFDDLEICRFRYVAFCLRPSRAEDFVDRPQALAPAFAALMRSDWDPVEKKLRCLRAISRADVDDARRYVLAKIVDIYVELDETEAERYAAEVKRESNKEVRHMVITWEDALAASKTEGKAEGKAEAARSHILRILRRRLSSVPSFVEAKLGAIDSVERLEEILDQAIVVSSTEELVLEP
ncbi:MAG: hypothetical protein V3T72_05495, partial [Thermoanaerobaculia bacterium]